jgi:cation transport ATPase
MSSSISDGCALRLLLDGQEIQVSLEKLNKGDIVVVHTGEVAPVDGVIVEGMAMIDQHSLTGESIPAERGVGDQVFAPTVMVTGKMHVSVEQSGAETATSKIAQILNDTAGYRLASQHRGEQLADKAVIPTLAVGALALECDRAAGSRRRPQQRHGHRHPRGGAGDAFHPCQCLIDGLEASLKSSPVPRPSPLPLC